jgi:cullin 4
VGSPLFFKLRSLIGVSAFHVEYDPEFGMGDHMFNDLALSRELLREYRDKIAMESSPHQLSVMVLQQSVWPFAARKTSCDLPPFVSGPLTQNYHRCID